MRIMPRRVPGSLVPLEPGTRVRHAGEQFTSAVLHGTAVVVSVDRVCRDGSVEYVVERDRPICPGMPTRALWNSDATVPVGQVTRSE